MKVLFRIILLCPFISFGPSFSQEEWDFDKKNQNKPLFLDTRAINGHTVQLLEKKVLELRITHRFGEIATPQSYRTLFGLDNSSDIRIENSNILDLYSGIGSFGIECLSRGAEKVTFIEKDEKAVKILKENLHNLSIIKQTKIFDNDIDFILKNKIIEK